MRTASIARRTRSAMALVAGAALLGLTACGADTEETPSAPAASSDGGGTQEAEPDPVSEATSDGTEDAGGDDQDAQGDQSDGTDAAEGAGERTRIMLSTDLGLDDTSGEGALVLGSDALAALLADPFGGTADCEAELVLAPGAAPVHCLGPASIESTEPTQEWVAHVVMVPADSGFQDGSSVAVLFSTGTALPEEAEDLLDEDVTLTGLGFGSVYGMDPLSAEDVAAGTLQTLTSDNSYVPVDKMADWEDVTCEDGLDFAQFETVDCAATTADGTTWDLVVAPGTYVDNDQGLLVGIDRTSDD
ncbi:hypothetical protein CFK38_06420 [Brachybacterium vulturis]|uniref:Uncharacterized protein n=1 Tax=Brachybacterium vulturis TaxID=2017484 RepID=A0A291GLX2_9MICO|nr:hypothetical protein [Brachybacterium vulturis]ATG51198.1 hypothetical protein CFK38_06420 [Brachybacterium vulturis]